MIDETTKLLIDLFRAAMNLLNTTGDTAPIQAMRAVLRNVNEHLDARKTVDTSHYVDVVIVSTLNACPVCIRLYPDIKHEWIYYYRNGAEYRHRYYYYCPDCNYQWYSDYANRDLERLSVRNPHYHLKAQ